MPSYARNTHYASILSPPISSWPSRVRRDSLTHPILYGAQAITSTGKILGAILAGGQSRRFGSDKAQALFEGERLIDRVAASLGAQCDELVVLGREEPGFTCLPDHPEPQMGPLGGLCAALIHAQAHGFAAVLAAPCDAPNLPGDLRAALAGDGAAIVQSQPVVGYWPAALAMPLQNYLLRGERRIYNFAEQAGARLVRFDPPLMNINEVGDLPG